MARMKTTMRQISTSGRPSAGIAVPGMPFFMVSNIAASLSRKKRRSPTRAESSLPLPAIDAVTRRAGSIENHMAGCDYIGSGTQRIFRRSSLTCGGSDRPGQQ